MDQFYWDDGLRDTQIAYNLSMGKKPRLVRLRNKIIREYLCDRWQEVCFFPQYPEIPKVKGFLGTSPVFFVSINPSFRAYPSKQDLFYYRNLVKQGFGNAHLTDVFKLKCKNDDTKSLMQDKKLLREMETILEKEIAIVHPKLIVGVGASYAKIYSRVFGKYKVPLEIIPHYAPQFNNFKKQKIFRAKLRDIRKKHPKL